MGLAWLICADPELVPGPQERLRKARCSGVSGGNAVWLYLGFWHSGGCLGQGRSPDPGAKKPRKPFTATADLLEYHPLTSTDGKLKLNSQERGPRAQRPQKQGLGERGTGAGGDLRLPLSPLRQQKGLRQMGGGGARKNPWLSCTPYPKPPQVSCPGRFLPPRAGLPAATLSPGRTQRVPAPKGTRPIPLIHTPKPPGSMKAPNHAGPNFPTLRKTPLRLPLPPRKVD